ncbi:uncharacterized protein TRIADDRAFT_61730 [Trichoplax adhaerens]|uniref:Poly [ADP-ribose] polymerase n=1 Tax=Trichoplax adhaerens TaxID=10228 RepID=B3SBT6_TRIAD|nr:hypothetical protein TRIADDRAFT_61730 [Trichoplax adhaerens]EDV19813.1 hypothetical protein TRIADDRAFT_61730 [Trichoplax adhaerens]|eukprot:XP_002117683.1 hypothetical protein TRIADDRAFT_61730 [Trichoplax adhaerens]
MKRKQALQKNPDKAKTVKSSQSADSKYEEYEEQMMLLWETRNKIGSECTEEMLRVMQSRNNRPELSGNGNLESCADGILFGAFKPCPICHQSEIRFSKKSRCYKCYSFMGGKVCEYVTDKAERTAWTIPEEFKAISPFLASYSYIPRDRVYCWADTYSPLPDELRWPTVCRSDILKIRPLGSIRITAIGKLKNNNYVFESPAKPNVMVLLDAKGNIKKKISNLGGIFRDQISKYIDLCISNSESLSKAEKQKIDSLALPVVSDKFLEFINDINFDEAMIKYAISNCTIDKIASIKNRRQGYYSTSIIDLRKNSKAVVDPYSGLQDDYHVIEDSNGIVYSVVLEKTPCEFLKLQALKHNQLNHCCFVRIKDYVAGIGEIRIEIEDGLTEIEAKMALDAKYFQKTGYSFINGIQSKRKAQKLYYPIGTAYIPDEDKEAIKLDSIISEAQTSKLSYEIQKLLKLIFNVKSIAAIAMEYQIDVAKLPLKNLTADRITKAMQILHQLDALSNKRGLKDRERLDKVTKLKQKFSSILPKELSIDGHRWFDDVFRVNLVEKESEEFNMICEYGSKTCESPREEYYKLKIEEIYKIKNHKSHKTYEKFCGLGNRMLLWNGNRLINYGRIFKQGIQPMATFGYLGRKSCDYGKGVYFSDMMWKAALDCEATFTNSTGLLLLCEVALGRTSENPSDVSKPRSTADSVKSTSPIGPDPSGNITLENDVIVPIGDINKAEYFGETNQYPDTL